MLHAFCSKVTNWSLSGDAQIWLIGQIAGSENSAGAAEYTTDVKPCPFALIPTIRVSYVSCFFDETCNRFRTVLHDLHMNVLLNMPKWVNR